MFESLFIVENYPFEEQLTAKDGLLAKHGLSVELNDTVEHTDYPIMVTATTFPNELPIWYTWLNIFGGKLTFIYRLTYDPSRIKGTSAKSMLQHYIEVLNSMLADLNKPVSAVHLLSEAEKSQILVEWNSSYKNFPELKGRCMHHWIEDQVKRTPLAVAIQYPAEGRPDSAVCIHFKAKVVQQTNITFRARIKTSTLKPPER